MHSEQVAGETFKFNQHIYSNLIFHILLQWLDDISKSKSKNNDGGFITDFNHKALQTCAYAVCSYTIGGFL